jgi:ATP-dependent Clp protease protease subunit
MKLLDRNGVKAGSPLKILNTSATEAEIIMYAGIGQASWFDDGDSMISAKQFSDQLKNLAPTVNTLNVRINSGGGDVFDGIAIYNRLKQFKGKKIVHVDGLAASIASIIALAGDEIIIGEGALFMIHLPWTYAAGNRMELDNTVQRLMDVEEQMLGIYAKKSNLSKGEIRAMLEQETWMSAEQAIDAGFADSKAEDTVAIAASAINSRWIAKKPGKYFSQTEAIQLKAEELKQKVRSRLDRK